MATTRRRFLQGASLAGLGLASFGLTACRDDIKSQVINEASQNTGVQLSSQQTYPFYGAHQAGITTPSQRHIYLLVADLHSTDVAAIAQMFKDWTAMAARLTRGENAADYTDNSFVPPTDTGEADSLGAWGLTLTFGISPSFLAKLGLQDKAPPEFVDLPLFPRDQLRENLTGGDICIQACSDDPQVAFHAVRQLVRKARSLITMRYSRMGFTSFDEATQTPRNLFGFKDGTANAETLKDADKQIWLDSPNWLAGGTYMVVRTVAMHLETWDRTSLNGQQETFGRHRDSGAPLGSDDEFALLNTKAMDADGKPVIPENSHAALAKNTGLQMLRRSYSYASGIDERTGQFDAGLIFVSFQKSPEQFIRVQNALGNVDKMTEYTTHIGSSLFACFGGVQEGEYLGQSLFEIAQGK